MEMKLNDFNRRGMICAFTKNPTSELMQSLKGDELVVFNAIENLQAKYFVVMKF